MWFVIGTIFGLVIGLRDKHLEWEKIAQKLINGEVIQIRNKFYKANKVNFK